MDCQTFHKNIFAFREGSLPEELGAAVRVHMDTCAACSLLLIEFDAIAVVMDEEKSAEPNPYAATRILQRLEHELEKSDRPRQGAWLRVLQPVAVTAALLCGILIGSYTARKGNMPGGPSLKSTENIEFLRSNLFISEFTDEDKILVLNK
jgi:anti-sigma factor RsiW